MGTDDELEGAAAFDEALRDPKQAAQPTPDGVTPNRAHLMRLLHEVYRAEAPAELSPEEVAASITVRMPSKVGRFQIRLLLGCGGFGAVYLADDPVLHRSVALKLFHPHVLNNPLNRQRVHREREVMARLQHPNIIPVWESGEDGETLYVISEYCAGPSLAQWLESHPQPLESPHAAGWLMKIADAVAHSHQRGVLHRDLKPSNILLEPPTGATAPAQGPGGAANEPDFQSDQWQPRLSDFGLAKYLQPQPGSSSSGETQSGLFVGSLEYASPEQIKGQMDKIGPASDIYALGVLLFQLLTARLPHAAASEYDLARHICDEDISFPAEFRQRVPRDLQAIALRALSREPADRYQSAELMREDLYRFLQGQAVNARPLPLWERGARWAKKYPAIAMLSTLCALLLILFLLNLEISNQKLTAQSLALRRMLDDSQRQQKVIEKERQRAADSEQSLSQLNSLASKQLAYNDWQKHDLISTYEVLNRIDESEAKSVEWQWLKRCMADTYLRYEMTDNPVLGLAVHPVDGALLTISESGKLGRWDLDKLQPVQFSETSIGASALAISPDGKTAAMPGGLSITPKSNYVELWELPAVQRVKGWATFHPTKVESIEFSPDGKWIASGPRYNSVIVTNLETNEQFAIKSGKRNRQIAFSPSSDRIAVNTEKSKIEIRELETNEVKLTIDWDGAGIASCAWIPGKELIIANLSGKRLQLRSTVDGKKLVEVVVDLTAESIAVSPDGKLLALGSNNGSIQLIDLELLQAAKNRPDLAISPAVRVLDGYVTDIVFSSNSQLVAADEEGSLIRLECYPKMRAQRTSNNWRGVRWLNNEELVVYSTGAPEYFKISGQVATPTEATQAKPLHAKEATNCALNPQQTLLAWSTRDGHITIVDATNGKTLSTATVNAGNTQKDGALALRRLLFSHDNSLLYVTGANNRISAIRVTDGSLVWEKSLTNSGNCLAEDPLNKRLFVGGSFETLKVFDSQTGLPERELTGGSGNYSLHVAAEQGQLISGHSDGTLRVRSLSLDTPAVVFRSNSQELDNLLVTRDGHTIITGDGQGQLDVWNRDAGNLGVLYRSALENPSVSDMAWSPDHSTMAAIIYSTNGTSELVLLAIFDPIQAAP